MRIVKVHSPRWRDLSWSEIWWRVCHPIQEYRMHKLCKELEKEANK